MMLHFDTTTMRRTAEGISARKAFGRTSAEAKQRQALARLDARLACAVEDGDDTLPDCLLLVTPLGFERFALPWGNGR